jgi:hypothetical protein
MTNCSCEAKRIRRFHTVNASPRHFSQASKSSIHLSFLNLTLTAVLMPSYQPPYHLPRGIFPK